MNKIFPFNQLQNLQFKPQMVPRESSIHHQALEFEIQTKRSPKISDFISDQQNSENRKKIRASEWLKKEEKGKLLNPPWESNQRPPFWHRSPNPQFEAYSSNANQASVGTLFPPSSPSFHHSAMATHLALHQSGAS